MFSARKFIRVKSKEEIFKTLDGNSAYENLPFMTEMIKYCGKVFQIQFNITKTCYHYEGIQFGEFPKRNVVSFNEIRCDGNFHSECKRGCLIFWKTNWLDPVKANEAFDLIDDKTSDSENIDLKVKSSDDLYYCQLTEMKKAVTHISHIKNIAIIVKDYKIGNYDLKDTLRNALLPLFYRMKIKLSQIFTKKRFKTPSISGNLKPGEHVRIKSLNEILKTLDHKHKNKGLSFYEEMRRYCGQIFVVREQLDKMIIEETGKIIKLKDTVTLEGLSTGCNYWFGSCLKKELAFWREIWLERVNQ